MAATITPGLLMDNLTSSMNANKPIIIMGLTVIFIGVMLFTFFDNPTALNSKTYTYTFTILVPLAIACGMLINMDKIGMTTIAIIIGVCALIAGVFYAYSQMSSAYYPVANYILNIIIFLNIAVGLAMIYNITLNNLNKLDGVPGFIVGLLFYIPCMISDFITYLLQQFNLTPNIVFVLFIIEIILILLYIYLPYVLKNIIVPPHLVLQNTPIFLDSQVEIANAKTIYPELFSKTTNLLASPSSPYNKNYCLSMWIYINPQNASNIAYANETEIFNYNDKTGSLPKPKMTYSYDPITGLDQYYLYFTQYKNPTIITVVGQKWNQFVFNYSNNIADVFINGNLERSFPMENMLPEYNNTDTITIGATNGLDGAICNVVYSNAPLTKYEIVNSYNLQMNNNPPINIE